MLSEHDRELAWRAEARKHGMGVPELKAMLLSSWEFVARPKQLPPPGDWWSYWFVMAGRGFGKEACIETPVPTPYGWKRLGDIDPGDLVFDESGRPCVVLETFDRTPEEAYRLTFSDGSTIDVGADHLWVTWDRAARKAYNRSPYEDAALPPEWPSWRLRRVVGASGLREEVVEEALALVGEGASERCAARRLGVHRRALTKHLRAGTYVGREPRAYDDSPGPKTRSTREIAETLRSGARGDLNHSIPVCLPLDLPERDLPLDPYVLGAWLGDGSSYGGQFAAHPDDQGHWYRELAEFSPHSVTNAAVVATFGLGGVLRKMGLLRNKHVPAEYLRASAAQRLALLQGLMDTDGSAAGSSVEFSNTNRLLISAVAELARSLGQKPVVAEGRSVYNGRDCGPKWRITWRPTVDVFRMERKARLVRTTGAQASRNMHRMIVGAERIPAKPMRCLSVASRHRTFLIGEAMIPTHNTLTGAEYIKKRALERRCRVALIAPTRADVRATMVEGETGLLSVIPAEALFGQSRDVAWNKTTLTLRLANDSLLTGFSSERPDRLRGPQHDYVWGEEVSSWNDAAKGAAVGSEMDTTWSNMQLGLRLGAHPRAVLTSTPKANKLTRDLVKLDAVALVRGSSYENRSNLSEMWWNTVVAPLAGTRTGRQEIEAELLEDVEGALWTRAMIDMLRVAAAPPLRRIVVAVDPNTTSGETADDAGIVVAGEAQTEAPGKRHMFVLDDRTQVRGGPRAWAAAAVDAYHDWDADRIVVEVNNGGEMAKLVIQGVDPTVPVKMIRATQGKRTRAEPVASAYEGSVDEPGWVHHVGDAGQFADLEDEMTTWTGDGTSPNRMDALVWALTELQPWRAKSQARGGIPRGRMPGTQMGEGLGDLGWSGSTR